MSTHIRKTRPDLAAQAELGGGSATAGLPDPISGYVDRIPARFGDFYFFENSPKTEITKPHRWRRAGSAEASPGCFAVPTAGDMGFWIFRKFHKNQKCSIMDGFGSPTRIMGLAGQWRRSGRPTLRKRCFIADLVSRFSDMGRHLDYPEASLRTYPELGEYGTLPP